MSPNCREPWARLVTESQHRAGVVTMTKEAIVFAARYRADQR